MSSGVIEFLSFPPEVRNLIYSFIFTFPTSHRTVSYGGGQYQPVEAVQSHWQPHSIDQRINTHHNLRSTRLSNEVNGSTGAQSVGNVRSDSLLHVQGQSHPHLNYKELSNSKTTPSYGALSLAATCTQIRRETRPFLPHPATKITYHFNVLTTDDLRVLQDVLSSLIVRKILQRTTSDTLKITLRLNGRHYTVLDSIATTLLPETIRNIELELLNPDGPQAKTLDKIKREIFTFGAAVVKCQAVWYDRIGNFLLKGGEQRTEFVSTKWDALRADHAEREHIIWTLKYERA